MKLADLMQDRKLVNRHTVSVLLSTDALEDFATAKAKVEQAQQKLERAQRAEAGRMSAPLTVAAGAELEQAQARLAEAEAAAAEHLVDFKFESIGSDAWEALIDAHQSPDEQRERLGDDDPGFDTKRFPLAAVAACLVEPEVDSLDDVKLLKSRIPDYAWSQMFEGVLQVNRGKNRIPPTWLASRTTLPSELGSGPAST
jgi:multidrug efflux pump subunit AcrA (membrane-fusion protein)